MGGDLTLAALEKSSPAQSTFKAVCKDLLQQHFPSATEEDLAIFLKNFCAKSKAKWQGAQNSKRRYKEKVEVEDFFKNEIVFTSQKPFKLPDKVLASTPKSAASPSQNVWSQ